MVLLFFIISLIIIVGGCGLLGFTVYNYFCARVVNTTMLYYSAAVIILGELLLLVAESQRNKALGKIQYRPRAKWKKKNKASSEAAHYVYHNISLQKMEARLKKLGYTNISCIPKEPIIFKKFISNNDSGNVIDVLIDGEPAERRGWYYAESAITIYYFE